MRFMDSYPGSRDDDEETERGEGPYLILDFDTNYESMNSPTCGPFSLSLFSQYKQLSIMGKKPDNLADFIKDSVYSKNSQSNKHRVEFYSPSFKKERMLDLAGNTFINNIVLRMRYGRHQDLMLVGDIKLEKKMTDKSADLLIVKGISLIDRNCSHCGEVTVECKIISFIGGGAGAHRMGYINASGRQFNKYPPSVIYKDTIFRRGFLERLQSKYIVPDPIEVSNLIDRWEEFMRSSEDKISQLSGEGFPIKTMKFQTVNRGPLSNPHDRNQVIDQNEDYCWTYEEGLPGFSECLILKVEHEVKIKDCTKEYLERFNRLTASEVKLKRFGIIKDDKGDYEESDNDPVRRIGSSRISVARTKDILPNDKLKSLDAKRQEKIEACREKIEEEFEKTIESELRRIKDSSEFEDEVRKRLEERKDELDKAIEEEFNDRIDELMATVEDEMRSLEERISMVKNESEPNDVALQELESQYQDAKSRYNRADIEKKFDKRSLIYDQTERFRGSVEKEILSEKEKILKEEDASFHEFEIEKETEKIDS